MSLLTTALVGALLPADVPESHRLTMSSRGYHVELRQSVFGWRSKFLTDVRRKSCMSIPGWPATLQALLQTPYRDLIGVPWRWNAHGTIKPHPNSLDSILTNLKMRTKEDGDGQQTTETDATRQ